MTVATHELVTGPVGEAMQVLLLLLLLVVVVGVDVGGVFGQVEDAKVYAVPQPAWQPEPQGKLTTAVGMAVGQSHGFDTVESSTQAGTAHDEQMVPVFVMVGQCALEVGVGANVMASKPSPAGAAPA